jgi:hypothetical protein
MIDIPEIYVEDPFCLMEGIFKKEMIEEYDIFFRRVVHLSLKDEIGRLEPIVAICEEEMEYYVYIDDKTYLKFLNRALKYFEWVEEYYTCSLVLGLINENNKL